MRVIRDVAGSLRADLRFAASAIALLSLTLGVTAGVVAIVQAVVLRPLPFGAPERVALLWQRDLRRALPVIEVAYGEAADWRRRSTSFDEIALSAR